MTAPSVSNEAGSISSSINSTLSSGSAVSSASVHSLRHTGASRHEDGRGLSRVSTIASVAQSLRLTATNVQDDNLQTEEFLEEARKTNIGRILTRPEYADAMRIATHKGPLQEELAEAYPDDERLLRALTRPENQAIADELHTVQDEEKSYPPVDKGYAWVICFAELMMTIATWGSSTSFGVYISYWLNNNTFKGADPLNYALSSSMTLFVAQFFSSLAMIIEGIIGLKSALLLGTLLNFLGCLLCSFSTKLWQLYMTQGVLIGFGFSLLFNPGIVVLGGWFVKYRAFASGIVVCGAGAGGAIFTLASEKLIEKDNSFHWAMRMLSIVTTVLNLICVCLLKERVPSKRDRSWSGVKEQMRVNFNPKPWKRWYTVFLWLWFAFGITGYIVLMYSLASFCTFIGLSSRTGAHITAIFNGCQAIGRPLLGVLGDKYGRLNMAAIMNIVVVILILAFFVNCTDFISILIFSIVSGLLTGWCQVMNNALLPEMGPLTEFPASWSYENMFVGATCLFSEVVALKLRQTGTPKPFLHGQIFSACMVFVSWLFIIPVREWKIRQIITRRLDICNEKLAADSNEDSENDELPPAGDEKSVVSSQHVLQRVERYEHLLEKGFAAYLRRLFYPIKV